MSLVLFIKIRLNVEREQASIIDIVVVVVVYPASYKNITTTLNIYIARAAFNYSFKLNFANFFFYEPIKLTYMLIIHLKC